jgi:hypothetical protein
MVVLKQFKLQKYIPEQVFDAFFASDCSRIAGDWRIRPIFAG